MKDSSWYEFYQKIFSEKEMMCLEDFLNKPFKKSLRVNTSRITISLFLKKAQDNGWLLEPIPWCPEGFWINRSDMSYSLGNSFLHHSGYFYMQEASSMFPPTLFDCEEYGGNIILDMAAAPGSKTTQLEYIFGYKTLIIGNELSSTRIKGMTSNLERLGTKNIIVCQKNGESFGKNYPNTFDKILLDAPCSGDGMIRKERKIIQSWKPQNSLFMSKLQKKLIVSAFEALKPGGELVYSTCTLSPYENENVIEYLIQQFPESVDTVESKYSGSCLRSFEGRTYDKRIKAGIRMLPWNTDGEPFFAIKIIKKYLSDSRKTTKPLLKKEVSYFPRKKEQIVISYLKKHFGIIFTIPKRHALVEYNNTVWMLPKRFLTEFHDLTARWWGMKLGEIHNHSFKVSHSFALAYGNEAKYHVVDLSDQDHADILLGKNIKNIEFQEKTGSVIILKYKDYIIGTGKIVDGMIKNLLPRSIISRQKELQ